MSDPLIDEARLAFQHFYSIPQRKVAAEAAKRHGAGAGDLPEGELEVREAIRCLMMALPALPHGTASLIAEALSASVRGFELMQKLRTRPDKAKARTSAPRPPYYIDKD